LCIIKFMALIILNGPTGAGKNTISAIIAKKRTRCAVVDFDDIRKMFVKPHKTPWDGEEGLSQQLLGVNHACLIAQSFLENKFDVILLDVLSEETAKIYKDKLRKYSPKLIFILPSFDEIERRNTTRPPRLTNQELEMVYKEQAQLKTFDHKIDNSLMSADEVAGKVNKLMG